MATDRRRALRVLGGAAASLVVAGCGGEDEIEDSEPSGPTRVGNVADLPEGTLRFASQLLVGRDAEGVYAMSALCTHTPCNMALRGRITDEVVVCGCHGSRFDRYGAVLKGPARRALPHYEVEVDAQGELTVLAGTVVPASTRLAV